MTLFNTIDFTTNGTWTVPFGVSTIVISKFSGNGEKESAKKHTWTVSVVPDEILTINVGKDGQMGTIIGSKSGSLIDFGTYDKIANITNYFNVNTITATSDASSFSINMLSNTTQMTNWGDSSVYCETSYSSFDLQGGISNSFYDSDWSGKPGDFCIDQVINFDGMDENKENIDPIHAPRLDNGDFEAESGSFISISWLG